MSNLTIRGLFLLLFAVAGMAAWANESSLTMASGSSSQAAAADAAEPSKTKRQMSAKKKSARTATGASRLVSVRVGESLSKIAIRLSKGTRASKEQVMLALYKANPAAFYRPNFHTIKAKVRLRLPPIKEVLALEHNQAKLEVDFQDAEWQFRRAQQRKAKVNLQSNPPAGSAEDALVQEARDRLRMQLEVVEQQRAQATQENAELWARVHELEQKAKQLLQEIEQDKGFSSN